MNKPLAPETEHLSPQGPCWGTWRGAPLPGNLRDFFDMNIWVMTKAAFNKNRALFTTKMDLELRKKLVKCYI
jgi:hypothetical protein